MVTMEMLCNGHWETGEPCAMAKGFTQKNLNFCWKHNVKILSIAIFTRERKGFKRERINPTRNGSSFMNKTLCFSQLTSNWGSSILSKISCVGRWRNASCSGGSVALGGRWLSVKTTLPPLFCCPHTAKDIMSHQPPNLTCTDWDW